MVSCHPGARAAACLPRSFTIPIFLPMSWLKVYFFISLEIAMSMWELETCSLVAIFRVFFFFFKSRNWGIVKNVIPGSRIPFLIAHLEQLG